MDRFKITAGFTDIKVELRARAGIIKIESEIELWFTFAHNILFAHDHADHSRNIIIASFDAHSNGWRNYMPLGRAGRPMVDAFTQSIPFHQIQNKFNELYRIYGYIPRR